MSLQGRVLLVPVIAGQNMIAGRAAVIAGSGSFGYSVVHPNKAGAPVMGVVRRNVQSGEPFELECVGMTSWEAGGPIPSGSRLMCDDCGRAVVAAPGDSAAVFGHSLGEARKMGDLVTVMMR